MASDRTHTRWLRDVDRVIYATITLMSVLVIYDGWNQLSLLALAGVIAGPVVAMFLSHVFSANLAHELAEGRDMTMQERIAIIRRESRFLLIGLPPLLLACGLALLGLQLNLAIRSVVAAGMASLGVLGGIAGRRAELSGWRLGLAVVGGFLIGAVILGIQVVLQPGQAI